MTKEGALVTADKKRVRHRRRLRAGDISVSSELRDPPMMQKLAELIIDLARHADGTSTGQETARVRPLAEDDHR